LLPNRLQIQGRGRKALLQAEQRRNSQKNTGFDGPRREVAREKFGDAFTCGASTPPTRRPGKIDKRMNKPLDENRGAIAAGKSGLLELRLVARVNKIERRPYSTIPCGRWVAPQ
jgi:hypothetical protein